MRQPVFRPREVVGVDAPVRQLQPGQRLAHPVEELAYPRERALHLGGAVAPQLDEGNAQCHPDLQLVTESLVGVR
jgi:hypothetical protein